MLRGINHVVLPVSRLMVSAPFYQHTLGFERVGERPGMIFYRAGGHHHDLALMETDAPVRDSVAHLCFDVNDEAALADLYRRLQDSGVAVSQPVDHTVMHSFYLLDPDRHTLEFGVDVPRTQWEDIQNPFGRDHFYPLLAECGME